MVKPVLPQILIPRPAGRAESLARALRAAGFEPITAPVIGFRSPANTSILDSATMALGHGCYPWAAITSRTAVSALNESVARTGTPIWTATMWAAVGPATTHALRAQGARVSLTAHMNSAIGLLDVFRQVPPSRIVLPMANVAATTLADGLRSTGWVVDVVTAYQTVAIPVPEMVRSRWAAGMITGVVLTSPSVARQVAAQLGPRADVAGFAIGQTTAQAARQAGLRVDAVAATATDDAIMCLMSTAPGLRRGSAW